MQLFACQNFTSEIYIVESTFEIFFFGCKKTFQVRPTNYDLTGQKVVQISRN